MGFDNISITFMFERLILEKNASSSHIHVGILLLRIKGAKNKKNSLF